MILFMEDWFKYPLADVHIQTKNKTWLRTAGILKKMGIKNHAFFLSILNPKLKDVDPHDPDLDDETKDLIAIESKLNPWYYFREVSRIPAPAGAVDLMFKLDRGILAYYWLAFNHITVYAIRPRQTGKTAGTVNLESYFGNTGATRTNISHLTKDDTLRVRTSQDVKLYVEALPEYMIMLSKKDVKNSERITFRKLGNSINFYVGQMDKKAADNLGRGMTTPIVHIDEFGYVRNIDITLPVLLTASTAAREIAAQMGSPYYTAFTTTPGKLNTREGRFAYEIYKDGIKFSETFYDLKNREELEDLLDKNKRRWKIVVAEFNYRQLGYDDKWAKKRMEESINTGENAKSDFFNMWISGSSNSPIDKKFLEIIQESKKFDKVTEVEKNGYVINYYVDKHELKSLTKEQLVIGLDTSDALGDKNDDIGLVIRRASDGSVVGVGKYNETNLSLFADFLVDLLIKYPKAVLIPERKSSGVAILDNMFKIMVNEGLNPFNRIFNWIVDEIDKNPFMEKIVRKDWIGLDIITKFKRQFGYATSGSGKTSRSFLYGNVLKASVKYSGNKVYDVDLIEQLNSLTIRNGRVDHEEGGHDDLVIAWLLGWWFLQYANNKQLYGWNVNYVLNDITDLELSVNNDLDKNYIKVQYELRRQIEHYISLLNNTDNTLIALKYYNKIKQLQKRLDTTIIKNLNIDAMLSEMKIIKKLKKFKFI